MPDQSVKRGAIPSPRSALAAAVPYSVSVGAPPNAIVIPQKISMWGNDVHGDCVTAEEAFAKACNNPEIFIPDDQVMAWATRHGVLEGANIAQVLAWMQSDGFVEALFTYDDGAHLSVDWTNAANLQSAIAQGPVKIGIAADQLETVYHAANGRTGWFATGFHNDNNEDHCTSLCGYGSISWLAQQLGVQVPTGINGAQPGYAMFTWDSIGIIDVPSMIAITHEAWLRQPTTVTSGGEQMSSITTGILSDGRTQVWLIRGSAIQSRWKVDTDPSAAWTSWSPFPSPPGVTPVFMSTSPLEDKRLQLYLVDDQNRVWSAWKQTPDASSGWTAWSQFS